MSQFEESYTIVDAEPPVQIIYDNEDEDLGEIDARFKHMEIEGEYHSEDEMDEADDPNYNEEEELRRQEESNNLLFANGLTKIPLKKYKQLIYPIILEFFISNDFNELIASLEELNEPYYIYEFIIKIIIISLDYNNKERELVSTLLSNYYPNVFSMHNVSKAFEILIKNINRLRIDIPNIEEILLKFIARAIVDEIVSPSFLLDPNIIRLNRRLNHNLRLFLTQKFITKKCENIWQEENTLEAYNNLAHINAIIDEIFSEYLLVNDLDDTIYYVKKLNMIYYLHEVVKRAIVIVMRRNFKRSLASVPKSKNSLSNSLSDANLLRDTVSGAGSQVFSSENEVDLLLKFLKQLSEENYLTEYQLTHGIKKVVENLDDLVLDHPHCKNILFILLRQLKNAKVIEPTAFSAEEEEILSKFLEKEKARTEDQPKYEEEEAIRLEVLALLSPEEIAKATA